jgi:hypothetical protein
MINSNLKKLINKYESLNFEITCHNNVWQIIIKNKFTNEEEFTDINEDVDDVYPILYGLLDGELLYDYNYQIIGKDFDNCYSFVKKKDKIILYTAEIFPEFIQISEIEFENELDFYIEVFRNFPTIDISHSTLKMYGFKTPLELFINHIKEKGYILDGFQSCGSDDDGYMDYLMIIQDSEGKKFEVDYPQKDGLYHVNSILTKLEDAKVISYHAEFYKLLIYLRDNRIKNYFDQYDENNF